MRDEGRERREKRHAEGVRAQEIIDDKRDQKDDAERADTARYDEKEPSKNTPRLRKIGDGIEADARKGDDDDRGRNLDRKSVV